MSQTHWKKLTNPDYIGAYALKPDEDLTVTIKRVVSQEVTGVGGLKSECLVAHLEKPHKPMILNATNSKSIEKLYGPYIEEWGGKQVTLYISSTQAKGETVACLRIRPTVPGPAKKRPISEERFVMALASVGSGKFSTAKIMDAYDLTPEQQARLPKQLEAGSVDA